MSSEHKSQVVLTGSSNRDAAVRTLFEHTGLGDLSGKSVALKTSFNRPSGPRPTRSLSGP